MAGNHQSYAIGGYDVLFPYKPYAPQLAFMGKVLAALEASRVKGNANALLESPTGSGKTLSLLCASLAWQQHWKKNKLTELKPGLSSEFYVQGGGFLPEEAIEEHGPEGDANGQPREKTAKEKREANKQEKKPPPKIFYTSRTHSQISQVIRELKKTNYKPTMAILASRKHYCTNKTVAKKKNIDEECKQMLHDAHNQCPNFKSTHKVRDHESLVRGGQNAIHDIEDLVGIGKSVKGCAYFAARSLASAAEIVFCPYNYILDPVIRKSMEVEVQGSIIIFDEAHNIEDVAREAATFNIDLTGMEDLRVELELLANGGAAEPYEPLLEVIQGMASWLRERAEQFQHPGVEGRSGVWGGTEVIQELEKAGLSLKDFPELLKFCQKAVRVATEADPDVPHLTGRAASMLDGLFMALNFMLENGARRLNDYRMVVQKNKQRDEAKKTVTWVTKLGFWCLNPAVAFDSLVQTSRSIILTSGTLSPMTSFASELGTHFESRMEGSHVVNVEKQVWAAALSAGPGNIPLNASFKNTDDPVFQDSIGNTLLECCKVIPDGTLVFFPSYKLLEKLSGRWKTTGLWNQLSALKKIFVEPKANEDQFEGVLAAYYKTIKKGSAVARNGKSKASSKGAASKTSTTQNMGSARAKQGCAAVTLTEAFQPQIVIGIPFPNVKDLQVSLKKQYNNANRLSQGLLSGDQWYCQQAFRALNQAVGRCIRHRFDYGAVLLIDERFRMRSNTEHISKWLKNSIRQYDNFGSTMKDLASFFATLKASPPRPNAVATAAGPRMFPMFKASEGCPENGAGDGELSNAGPKPVLSISVQNVQLARPSSCSTMSILKDPMVSGALSNRPVAAAAAHPRTPLRELPIPETGQKSAYASPAVAHQSERLPFRAPRSAIQAVATADDVGSSGPDKENHELEPVSIFTERQRRKLTQKRETSLDLQALHALHPSPLPMTSAATSDVTWQFTPLHAQPQDFGMSSVSRRSSLGRDSSLIKETTQPGSVSPLSRSNSGAGTLPMPGKAESSRASPSPPGQLLPPSCHEPRWASSGSAGGRPSLAGSSPVSSNQATVGLLETRALMLGVQPNGPLLKAEHCKPHRPLTFFRLEGQSPHSLEGQSSHRLEGQSPHRLEGQSPRGCDKQIGHVSLASEAEEELMLRSLGVENMEDLVEACADEAAWIELSLAGAGAGATQQPNPSKDEIENAEAPNWGVPFEPRIRGQEEGAAASTSEARFSAEREREQKEGARLFHSTAPASQPSALLPECPNGSVWNVSKFTASSPPLAPAKLPAPLEVSGSVSPAPRAELFETRPMQTPPMRSSTACGPTSSRETAAAFHLHRLQPSHDQAQLPAPFPEATPLDACATPQNEPRLLSHGGGLTERTSGPPDSAPGGSLFCHQCGIQLSGEDLAGREGEVHHMPLRKRYLLGLWKEASTTRPRPVLTDECQLGGAGGGRPPGSDRSIAVCVAEASLFAPLRGSAWGLSPLQDVRGEGKEEGVWVKEDGCVYRPLACPGCQGPQRWLGAEVLAADRANSFLAGMVLLFEESVTKDPRPQRPLQSRAKLPHNSVDPGEYQPIIRRAGGMRDSTALTPGKGSMAKAANATPCTPPAATAAAPPLAPASIPRQQDMACRGRSRAAHPLSTPASRQSSAAVHLPPCDIIPFELEPELVPPSFSFALSTIHPSDSHHRTAVARPMPGLTLAESASVSVKNGDPRHGSPTRTEKSPAASRDKLAPTSPKNSPDSRTPSSRCLQEAAPELAPHQAIGPGSEPIGIFPTTGTMLIQEVKTLKSLPAPSPSPDSPTSPQPQVSATRRSSLDPLATWVLSPRSPQEKRPKNPRPKAQRRKSLKAAPTGNGCVKGSGSAEAEQWRHQWEDKETRSEKRSMELDEGGGLQGWVLALPAAASGQPPVKRKKLAKAEQVSLMSELSGLLDASELAPSEPHWQEGLSCD